METGEHVSPVEFLSVKQDPRGILTSERLPDGIMSDVNLIPCRVPHIELLRIGVTNVRKHVVYFTLRASIDICH